MCGAFGDFLKAPLKLHTEVSDAISPKFLRSDGSVGKNFDFANKAAKESVRGIDKIGGEGGPAPKQTLGNPGLQIGYRNLGQPNKRGG